MTWHPPMLFSDITTLPVCVLDLETVVPLCEEQFTGASGLFRLEQFLCMVVSSPLSLMFIPWNTLLSGPIDTLIVVLSRVKTLLPCVITVLCLVSSVMVACLVVVVPVLVSVWLVVVERSLFDRTLSVMENLRVCLVRGRALAVMALLAIVSPCRVVLWLTSVLRSEVRTVLTFDLSLCCCLLDASSRDRTRDIRVSVAEKWPRVVIVLVVWVLCLVDSLVSCRLNVVRAPRIRLCEEFVSIVLTVRTESVSTA